MINKTKGIPETDTPTKKTSEEGGTGKIDEAFDILNNAIKEKEEEINEFISTIKHKMSAAVGSNKLTETVIKNISGIMHEGEERLKEVTSGIDKKFHQNPWIYLCAVAAGCFLWGYITHGSEHSKKIDS
ncbi:MAG: hypothetical protein E3K32_01630 [wastewater metagenome]|nr:hypothetical protein [Candidatus Loosdrechtia aerotolerans]